MFLLCAARPQSSWGILGNVQKCLQLSHSRRQQSTNFYRVFIEVCSRGQLLPGTSACPTFQLSGPEKAVGQGAMVHSARSIGLVIAEEAQRRHPQGSLAYTGWPNTGHRPSTAWSGVGACEGGGGCPHSCILQLYSVHLRVMQLFALFNNNQIPLVTAINNGQDLLFFPKWRLMW